MILKKIVSDRTKKKMTYRGGGKSGRSIVKVTSEAKVKKMYEVYRSNQNIALKENIYKYDKENDKLFRRFSEQVTNVKIRSGLSDNDLNLAKSRSIFDQKYHEHINESKELWFYIPPIEIRTKILQDFHTVFHNGATNMKLELKKQCITWPQIQQSVMEYVKKCTTCQMTKSTGKTSSPFRTIVSEYPLQHMYIDISFMPRDNKFIGAITLIDHFTKRVWSVPIRNRRAETVSSFLVDVFEDIGLKEMNEDEPNVYQMCLRSDNGAELISETVVTICRQYGISKKQGAPYAPWMQGVVERVQQSLKKVLHGFMHQEDSNNWASKIQEATDFINTRNHRIIGMSPLDAWNRCFTLDPKSLTQEQAGTRISTILKIKSRMKAEGEKLRVNFFKKNPNAVEEFVVSDHVLVRVPERYRSAIKYLWGRKAMIESERFDSAGISFNEYKVKWLETGGIRPNEKSYTSSSYYIHARDLKHFYYGNDNLTEPPTQDENISTNNENHLIYSSNDYEYTTCIVSEDSHNSLDEGRNEDKELEQVDSQQENEQIETVLTQANIPPDDSDDDIDNNSTVSVRSTKRQRNTTQELVSEKRCKHGEIVAICATEQAVTLWYENNIVGQGMFIEWITQSQNAWIRIVKWFDFQHPLTEYMVGDVGNLDVDNFSFR